ncbi:hypothetical protein HK405_001684, partial [Cladochytrium tenue]
MRRTCVYLGRNGGGPAARHQPADIPAKSFVSSHPSTTATATATTATIPVIKNTTTAIETAVDDGTPPLRRPGTNECEERRLAEDFFASRCLLALLLHRRSYLQKLDAGAVCAELRLAVCAAGASAGRRGPLANDECAVWYYDRARALLSDVFDARSVEKVQALLILSSVSLMMGLISTSWQLMGLCASTAVVLQLQVDPDELPFMADATWVEKEARRRIWWLIITLDR